MAKHFNVMCKNDNNIFQFLFVQIIEQVCSNATNIEEMLWNGEKYWQSQLLTIIHGMSSLTDLYCYPNVRGRGNDFATNYF